MRARAAKKIIKRILAEMAYVTQSEIPSGENGNLLRSAKVLAGRPDWTPRLKVLTTVQRLIEFSGEFSGEISISQETLPELFLLDPDAPIVASVGPSF